METLCRLSYWGGARAPGAVDGSQRYTAPPSFRQTVRCSRRSGSAQTGRTTDAASWWPQPACILALLGVDPRHDVCSGRRRDDRACGFRDERGPGSGATLRLVWPQWQGAGTTSVRDLAPEFPFDVARRGYAVGSAVLAAVLPANEGPTAGVPVAMDDAGLEVRDGIEAKPAILTQLAAALEVVRRYDPARIVALGGECAVSVAPFAHLARRYGDDLAIVWIDSNPDVGTPESRYPGFHAMAVAALTGHGDREVLDLLPATVSPARVALVGLHAWAVPHLQQLLAGFPLLGPRDSV
jgi:Arginase family